MMTNYMFKLDKTNYPVLILGWFVLNEPYFCKFILLNNKCDWNKRCHSIIPYCWRVGCTDKADTKMVS